MNMETYTKYFKAAAFIAVLLLGIGAEAQTIEQPIVDVLKGSSGQLKPNFSCSVQDSKWWATDPALDTFGAYRIKNIISLKLNEDTPAVMKPKFSVTVKIKLFITNRYGVVDSSQTPSLSINYDTLTGATYNTQDILSFYNAYKVSARILSVDSAYIPTSISPKPPVTQFVRLENEMQIVREYNFSCTELISNLHNLRDSGIANGELRIFWDNSPGATEYDLEWVYIDNESISDSFLYRKPNGNLDTNKIFLDNATRITIRDYNYNIPMLYPDSGTLYYRYRPVQNKPNGQRDEGKWSSDNSSGLKSYTGFAGHEIDLNWQATTSFAEEGKRKSVVQYYDGSLRSRQTVTKDNTTNTTVVAETLYDYQGRAVIQVLPAPTLSNIISYTRNFNRRENSDYTSGYTKDLYDTLLNPSDYCLSPAPPMGKDSSGASMYYSTSNPQASIGFNKFIPDAELYPFSETRYTQDNTGRVLAQSGVGNNFKIGSGHETKYFYGNPDQKELDGLFGTEVGYASHYFKKMVRDANGQYSVTYVDMHGRTIATALAGKVPASLDTLPSYNKKNITETLADSSNNITRDLLLESSRSILVTDSVSYTFNYNLTPDSLRLKACDSSYICYDCLYNLEIIITDECNNCHLPNQKPYVVLDSNFTFTNISTTCGDSVPGFHKTFVVGLPEGNYTITKRLSISKYGMDYYRDSVFMKRNTCRTFQDFYNTVSDSIRSQMDCNAQSCDSCTAHTGSLAAFRIYYLNSIGISLADSAKYRDEISFAYTEAKEDCDFTCGNVGQHTFIRKAMLLDMTAPVGQYANPDSACNAATKRYNIFNCDSTKWKYPTYHDEYGKLDSVIGENGVLVPVNQLSKEQFIKSFKDCWANDLLYLHPEYPKLVKYETYTASHIWDEKFNSVETFNEANLKGMLNPVYSTTTERPLHLNYYSGNLDPGASTGSIAASMQNKVHLFITGDNLSLWGVASVSGKCSNVPGCASNYTNNHLNRCLNDSTFCDGELDMAWRSFRQIYQTTKRRIVMDKLHADFPLIRGSLPASFNEHFASSAPALDSYNSSVSGQSSSGVTNIINGHIQNSYKTNCEDFAASWWGRLAPCFFGVTNTDSLRADSTRLISRMVAICIAGSDASHNFGSSSTAPGSTLKYKSFEELIRFYIDSMHAIYPTVYNYNYSCNADLINMPQPYDQQTSLSTISIWTRPDSCQCSTISSYYSKYKQNGSSDSSFSAYILRKTGTTISNADLTKLLNMCNGIDTCKFLVTPISLPPALQCGIKDVCVSCEQVQSAFNIFKIKYPDIYPSYNEDDSIQIIKNATFTNCMNNQLGFTKTAFDYLEFMGKCGTKYIADSSRCDSLNKLLGDFRNFYSSINFAQVFRTGRITSCAQNVVDAANALITARNNANTNILENQGYARAPFDNQFNVKLKSVTPNSASYWDSVNTFNNAVMPLNLDCSVKPLAGGTGTEYDRLNANILYPYEFIRQASSANILGHNPVFGTVAEDHDEYLKMIWADDHSDFDYRAYGAPTPLRKYVYNNSATPYEAHIYSLGFIDAPVTVTTPALYNSYYDPYVNTNNVLRFDNGGFRYKFIKGIPFSAIKKIHNLRFDANILSQTSINPTDLSPKYLMVTVDYLNGTSGNAYIQINDSAFNDRITFKEVIDTNLYNPNCQKAFTTYYNSHQSPVTNYTYAQIDSIFFAKCGIHPSPCSFMPPICDTLNKVVEEYNNSLTTVSHDTAGAELGIFNLTNNPYYPDSTNSYHDTANLHPGMYIYNGMTNSMPDSASTYRIANLLGFCTGPDLTFEFRVKRDSAQAHRMNRGAGTEIVPQLFFNNGSSISVVINSEHEQYTGMDYPNYIRHVNELINPFDDWTVVKIKVAGDSAYVYYDGVWKHTFSLRGMPARTKITSYSFANINSYYYDWVKLYGADGQLKYNENFADIKHFVRQPADWICTSICDTSFTTFLNNRFGTSLNNTQVQKLYQNCGREGADCGQSQLVLCGKNEPLFPDIEFTEPDPCADSSSMIFVKATELYRSYLDSLNNAFDSAYLAKCKKAFKTETFTVTHQVSEYHYTLYYYDQSGNLVKTVPPAGVDQSGRDRSTWFDSVAVARKNGTYLAPSHGLATNYRYNTLNQVVEQSTPDAGKSTFFYDRLGRIAISQNAKQYAKSGTENGKQYSYTKYDLLGRIIEVGQLSNNTTTVITQGISQDETQFATWFTNATNTNANIEQVTRTYYDNKYPASVGLPILYPKNLRNRVAYTSYIDGNSTANYNQATFYSYDIHGNVDTLLQDYGQSLTGTANIMNSNSSRWKRMVYQYDLISGKVNNVAYQPQYIEEGVLKIPQDAFYHRYSYDAENRITSVETSADSTVWEKDARYEYYKHGPLARTVIGQLQVQGVDYAYTLQGWLKGVNSTTLAIANDMGNDGDPANSATKYIARDAISFNLNYFSTATGMDYTPIGGTTPFANVNAATYNGANYRPLFNGNISSMAVNIRRFNSTAGTAGDSAMLYSYKYDQLNRLMGRDAYRGLNTGTNAWGTNMTSIDQYREKLSYDANGNILKYFKNGNLTGSNVYMDSLLYTYYANSNQLLFVKDSITDARYSTDIDNQSAGNYLYDEIGNLRYDFKENISSIVWNVYGKISSITKSDPGGSGSRIKQVQYTYDAAGQRISKRVSKYNTTTVEYTWYVKDASGNAMSIYNYSGDSTAGLSAQILYQKEINLYGSSRIGSLKVNRNVEAVSQLEDSAYKSPLLADSIRGKFFVRGNKQYELNNHLGNVLATISDKKIPYSSNGTTVSYYNAEFTNAFDYYSFGMIMPGRQYYIDSTINAIISSGLPLGNPSTVQIYRHGFEGTPYNKPYTVAPAYADAHLSNSSWTNNRTSETAWTTYNSFSNSTALGLPGNADTSNTITFTVKVDSGYAMTVKSFSFYDRSSSTGYKNWSMKINGITVGADTTYVDNPGGNHVPRSTGTVNVANPVKNLTGTISVVITLNNKGAGSQGTFKIDSFIVNGFIIPLSDTGYSSSLYVHNGYRYRVNTQEYSPELNDDSYTAEFWQYDARLGRRWNLDPSPTDGISGYSAFANNPNFFTDPLGDTSKFFGNDGSLMYQDNKGKGNDLYVVDNGQFNLLRSKYKNKNKLTSELVKVGVKAYDNQDAAAAAWVPDGFAATKSDNFERGARIFRAKTFGDQKVPYLYIVGSTVKGHKSDDLGVSQETDPSGSTATLNGQNITLYKSTITVTTRRGNVIVSQKEITYHNWQVSAMVHSHPDRHDDYSFGPGDMLNGKNFGGDYGIAVDGISVYLVPTTGTTVPYRMFRLDLSPDDNMMYFESVRKAQEYMNEDKKTIYLHEGKVESIYWHGGKVQ